MRIDPLLRALADPTRLRLLNLWKPNPPAHALPADLQGLADADGLRVLTHPR